MKKLFFPVVLASALTVAAQQPTKEVPDAKAKTILDELSAKTKACNSIKSDFVIETIGADKKVKETNSGSLTLKGEKYVLSVKGQKIVCDTKTQWTIIEESKEVQVNDVDPTKDKDKISPTNIFTIYEKGYKYKFEKEETMNGALVQVINLYPLDPSKKPYHTVKLYIDKTKKQVVMVKILNKDATVTSITVKNFTCYTESNEAQFSVTKKEYPGPPWEWIDLREN